MISESDARDNRNHRPEIDLLRTIAVGLVVLYHAGLGFPGGYVGVDVFVVISGFLIINLIFRGSCKGTFKLTEFFRRRIRRLAPASIVMIGCTLVAGFLLLEPAQLRSLGSSAIANQFFLQNFYFSKKADYFCTASELMPLLHTWSLAVEEQFYLLIPCIAFLLRGSRARWLAFLGLVLVGSFVTSVLRTPLSPQAAFFLLPSRAWELAVGGIVAILGKSMRASFWSESASWVGVGLIAFASLTLDSETEFPGFLAGLPVVGTLLVIIGAGGHHSG